MPSRRLLASRLTLEDVGTVQPGEGGRRGLPAEPRSVELGWPQDPSRRAEERLQLDPAESLVLRLHLARRRKQIDERGIGRRPRKSGCRKEIGFPYAGQDGVIGFPVRAAYGRGGKRRLTWAFVR